MRGVSGTRKSSIREYRPETMTGRLPIPSPCVGVCELDPVTGLCRGCLRNGEEIAAWRDAGDTERRDVLNRIGARRAAEFDTLNSARKRTDG
jgi:uncharacterized protein